MKHNSLLSDPSSNENDILFSDVLNEEKFIGSNSITVPPQTDLGRENTELADIMMQHNISIIFLMLTIT